MAAEIDAGLGGGTGVLPAGVIVFFLKELEGERFFQRGVFAPELSAVVGLSGIKMLPPLRSVCSNLSLTVANEVSMCMAGDRECP